MFSKKSCVIAFALMQIVFSSFAMEPQESFSELYAKLLNTVGNNLPYIATLKKCPVDKKYFQQLFKNAASSGLIKQYQILISTEEGGKVILPMLDQDCLMQTAYMQNKYGQGDKFKYDGKGTQEDVVVGDYVNPYHKTIVVTRYSFLNGLLEQIDAATPAMKANTHFQKIVAQLSREFQSAIFIANKANPTVNPLSKFNKNMDTIMEFGRALSKANDEAALSKLNKQLEAVIRDFQ